MFVFPSSSNVILLVLDTLGSNHDFMSVESIFDVLIS